MLTDWQKRLLERLGAGSLREMHEALAGRSKHGRARMRPKNWCRDRHKRRKLMEARRKQAWKGS